MHVGRVGRPIPHNLDAYATRADVKLLDPHRYTYDAGMAKHQVGNAFGERFEKRDMFLRHDDPNAVSDHIVGEDVPHILYGMAGTTHLDVDVETDVLRLAVLARIGADTRGNDEIADEDTIGRRVSSDGVDGISPRRKQPIVDLCHGRVS